ncbi:SLC13/DASS family transporter [Thermosipho ferrireducens]|uniref:SLC13/DASS family transporter n=1 Tax=Thermosipho ferrireducens TaxID=2571116 RepID=A0ABX7S986_9BACT|nr:DASS family sodium-coupled anion symporter [Thermosipho ferrireducens]QTA38425.1 SLC13/DASS family transporter [Thermosipho ferrireducens]
MKRKIIFGISLIVFLLPYFLSPPAGLTIQGFKALSVFAISLFWWITNVVPLMITSLFAIVAFPLMGLASSKEVYSYFGNTAVFFLIGSFILASAFKRSGLSKKIAFSMIKLSKSSKALVLFVQYTAMFLSFLMSGHAVVAILIPIVLEVRSSEKLLKPLIFSVMWGAIIGSNATLLGGARGPLAIALLQAWNGQSISFSKWSIASLPIVVTTSIASSILLFKITPYEKLEIHVEEISTTKRQIQVGMIMAASIFFWFSYGEKFGIANISLAAVIILFMLKLIKWKEVEEDVNWGIILMYGGAIVLGKMLQQTGVASWFVEYIKNMPGGLFLVLLSISALVLTETMSNSAVVVMLMQIALPAATRMGIDPRLATLAVTIPAGFAFMLPMSSPSVAIALSTGRIDLRDTIKYGILLEVVAVVSIILFGTVVWKVII